MAASAPASSEMENSQPASFLGPTTNHKQRPRNTSSLATDDAQFIMRPFPLCLLRPSDAQIASPLRRPNSTSKTRRCSAPVSRSGQIIIDQNLPSAQLGLFCGPCLSCCNFQQRPKFLLGWLLVACPPPNTRRPLLIVNDLRRRFASKWPKMSPKMRLLSPSGQ